MYRSKRRSEIQKSVGLVYPAGDDGVQFYEHSGKSFLELRPAANSLRMPGEAACGSRREDCRKESHVASEHGREECYSFVPAGSRDQSTQK